jgi:glycosyltransferase involved in cell wall biosynthesis
VEDAVGGKTNPEVMSSPSPLVSVLMPAYNAEKFISEAINSILSQDYSNWELLILNDASTDSTQAIIDGFEDNRIQISHHSENQGYLISCNKLFGKAKGDFITFLDADDMCPFKRIDHCLNEFEKNSKLDFLTTGYSRIQESGELLSTHLANIDFKRHSEDTRYNPIVCCATIFLKRELLVKVGGYRPFFKEIGGEDYYWLWELSRAGKGQHLTESLYDYRRHTKQTSTTHKDDLFLFLPELVEQLRTEFSKSDWEQAKADKIKEVVQELYVRSQFQLHLRKGQQSINRAGTPFWNHVAICFTQIRKPKELGAFLYLIYSWGVRNLQSAAL